MHVVRFLARALVLGIVASLTVTAAATALTPAERLAALGNEFYLEQARFDPVQNATLVGDNRFDDQLNLNISPLERSKHQTTLQGLQKRLHAIQRARLNNEDGLTYDVLSTLLRMNVDAGRFPDHLLPVSQVDAVPVTLANFGSGQAEQPMKTVIDYQAYFKRISRLPVWIDQAITNMRAGMKQGIVQPRSIVGPLLEQLKALNKPLADNPYYQPVNNMPASFADTDKQQLKQQYTSIVEQQILPATRKLAEFVEKEYVPASRTTDGWNSMPNGAAWYRDYVRYHTTTTLSPEQIHELGLKEVARIRTEVQKLAPQLGYVGNPAELLVWMRTNPEFLTFKTDTQILDAYRAINEKVKLKLPSLFGRIPKAALDIREEPELTRDAASDHYSLGSEDGSRPGVFWAVIIDPATYNSSTMATLFLHEGQPGHHFQLSLVQEATLPQFRKKALLNAYVEGWALYAETLGHETGLYDDPALHAGNLRFEMMRAVRLVVDTGIHAKGWTHDRAVKYMMDNTGLSEQYVRGQIERYIAWPGQALSYKLGALKIQALRERAKQKMGGKFNLAAFHDEVLREGPLPLSVLDEYINRWIATQQSH